MRYGGVRQECACHEDLLSVYSFCRPNSPQQARHKKVTQRHTCPHIPLSTTTSVLHLVLPPLTYPHHVWCVFPAYASVLFLISAQAKENLAKSAASLARSVPRMVILRRTRAPPRLVVRVISLVTWIFGFFPLFFDAT